MTTLKISYGTATGLACTTTSLVTDANLLSGRQSVLCDNTSTLADDYILGGSIVTGSGTLTANTVVECWLFGLIDGTNYIGNSTSAGSAIGGVSGDSAATLTSVGVKNLMSLAIAVQQIGTAAVTYYFGVSVLAAFGGMLPSKWGFFITHNTGQNLGATTLTYQSVTYTNV